MTAEEITALETEVTDLQEERTQILEQAERRNNLLVDGKVVDKNSLVTICMGRSA